MAPAKKVEEALDESFLESFPFEALPAERVPGSGVSEGAFRQAFNATWEPGTPPFRIHILARSFFGMRRQRAASKLLASESPFAAALQKKRPASPGS